MHVYVCIYIYLSGGELYMLKPENKLLFCSLPLNHVIFLFQLEDVRSDSDSDEVESDTSCDINENGISKSNFSQQTNGHTRVK